MQLYKVSQKRRHRYKVNYSTFRKRRENFWSEAVVWGCSVEKMFLEILQNSQENTCTRAFFLKKIAGHKPATLLKKWPWHRCFPVNFAKLLRTPFLQNTSGGCFCLVFILYLNTPTINPPHVFKPIKILTLSWFHI